jgi:hypothetical protein
VKQRIVFGLQYKRSNVRASFIHRPLKNGLDFEATALTIFVIGGDPRGGRRLHIVDPVDVVQSLSVSERRSARVAAFSNRHARRHKCCKG